MAPGAQIDARTGAHGRRKSITTSDRRRRGSAAARAPTAHFGGGGVFEVAFLKGYVLEHPQPPTVHSGRGGLSLLRPKVVNTIWGVRAQFFSFGSWWRGGRQQTNKGAARRGGSAGRRVGGSGEPLSSHRFGRQVPKCILEAPESIAPEIKTGQLVLGG